MKKSGILFFCLFIILNFVIVSGLSARPADDSPVVEKKAVIEQHLELGTGLYKQKEYGKANEVFQAVLELDPGNEKAKYYIADAHSKLQEQAKERQEAAQELKQNSEKQIILNIHKAGEYHLKKAEYKKAIKHFEKISALEPQNQKAKDSLAHALLKLGESEEDIKKSQTVALVNAKTELEVSANKDLEIYLSGVYEQAKGFLEAGRLEDTKDMFEEIEKIDPFYRDVKNRLAGLRLALGVEKEEKKLKEDGYAYTLGPDDVVHLIVKDQPKLGGTITIQPAGELLLPEVNEIVMVNGLTKQRAKQRIKKVLSKYVKDVSVELIIAGYNSKKWYVIGEVGGRGEYPMDKPVLTLTEALYKAGLPVEDSAAMRNVRLIKPHPTNPREEAIDVYSLLYQGRTQNNVVIQPGDIIYVPRTVLQKVKSLMSEVGAPISSTSTILGDMESVFTIVPVTRVGSGAGQKKYKKYPWPWAQ